MLMANSLPKEGELYLLPFFLLSIAVASIFSIPNSDDYNYYKNLRDFPGSPVAKTSPSTAGGAGSIPGRERGAKIPHALQPKNQNIKQKQYCNKFNKDSKNDPNQKKKIFEKNLEACIL